MFNRRKKRYYRSLFTLLEMIVVIAIIAFIMGIGIPATYKHLKKARITTANAQIRVFVLAINDFRIDTGKLPSSLDDLLKNSSQDNKWDGPYLANVLSIPKDPWGNDYVYIDSSEHGDFEIKSYGNDGSPGGTGEAADISSIQGAE